MREPQSLILFNKIPNNQLAFASKVIRIAELLNTDPDYLMQVMYFESRLDPAKKNPHSTATGLIQFLEATAKGLGTTTAKLSKMSNVEQLDYVYKHLYPFRGKLTSLVETYLSVFYPKAVGKPSDYVFPLSPKWVQANKLFDLDNNKVIAKSEVARYLDSYYSSVKKKLKP